MQRVTSCPNPWLNGTTSQAAKPSACGTETAEVLRHCTQIPRRQECSNIPASRLSLTFVPTRVRANTFRIRWHLSGRARDAEQLIT